jgi:hypothetical protein
VVSAPALLANEAPPIAPSYRLEKHFQAVVIARAKLYGWRVHFVFNSRKSPEGWPDLTLVRGKVTLFRELKRSRKEKPTPAQLDWLEALRDAGHDAKVWTPENREEIYETLR